MPAHSHGVVVDGSVFGGVPLKDKLPVVQVARASALLEPAQVALLMVDILKLGQTSGQVSANMCKKCDHRHTK